MSAVTVLPLSSASSGPSFPELSRRSPQTKRPFAHNPAPATAMANHYPAHAQAQGYQAYPAAQYGYPATYYPGYPPQPGVQVFSFNDPAAGSARPQGGPPTAPEIPGVSSQLASHCLHRLISAEMRDAGFESAEPGAMRRLELEVVACASTRFVSLYTITLTPSLPVIEQLYERAHEYANLANRAKPVVSDVLSASDDYNLEAAEVYRFSRKSRKRKRGVSCASHVCIQSGSCCMQPSGGQNAITLLPPPPRSPSPELLSSDDEGVPPTIPMTLRPLPHYAPPLPPKHTYLRTPVRASVMRHPCRGLTSPLRFRRRRKLRCPRSRRSSKMPR